MVLAEGSTPGEAVNLSLITRPLLEGGRGGVERARLDWDFKPDGRERQYETNPGHSPCYAVMLPISELTVFTFPFLICKAVG